MSLFSLKPDDHDFRLKLHLPQLILHDLDSLIGFETSRCLRR
jgi:hypothetical protein